MSLVNIRDGRKEDCTIMAKFLRELGDYVGQASSETAGVNELEEAGFGDAPLFNTYIAEITDESGHTKIAGMLLYYHCFSMFRCKTLHMETLFVHSDYRNQGIGILLIKKVAKKALSDGCTNMTLTANALNTNAIRLYERHGLINHYKAMNINLLMICADKTALERLAVS